MFAVASIQFFGTEELSVPLGPTQFGAQHMLEHSPHLNQNLKSIRALGIVGKFHTSHSQPISDRLNIHFGTWCMPPVHFQNGFQQREDGP